MKSVIIYGSQYGFSKRYAEELGELTGVVTYSYDVAPGLSSCDQIVYVGGLYAGNMTGFKEFAKTLPQDVKLILVTVGLMNPENKDYTDKIQAGLRKKLPQDLQNNVQFFHLRGGIDYGPMSRTHKMMMGALCAALKTKPAAKRGVDENLVIDSYQKEIDLTDFKTLAPIVEAMKE